MIRLNVNIDHIATLRQARRTFEPSVVSAAVLADLAGASGITIHLRADRRHIQDDDLRTLRAVVKTHLNLEMAATGEMLAIALETRPDTVTLVPEKPDEITTEGGLDAVTHEEAVRACSEELAKAGIVVSLFIDPLAEQIQASRRVGARQVEICTAKYSELTDPTRHATAQQVEEELSRIADSARMAGDLGLKVAAGHGLTYRNVAAIAEIYPVEELNIGHNIVARAALVGMERAVRAMISAIESRR
ncbi:MAG TPA: pyridoxine 5'-phosphate synthase [Blastocatellia bacterium]|nr:pyridoxine 5'-phosphate synthase [Blastocatellia bacterium]